MLVFGAMYATSTHFRKQKVFFLAVIDAMNEIDGELGNVTNTAAALDYAYDSLKRNEDSIEDKGVVVLFTDGKSVNRSATEISANRLTSSYHLLCIGWFSFIAMCIVHVVYAFFPTDRLVDYSAPTITWSVLH